MYLAGKHQPRTSLASRPQPRNRAIFAAAVSIGSAAALLLSGCGNQYRPVVSSINPVGPAQQPTKYAVAVSNPGSSQLGLLTIVDFSGDTVLTTPQILANPSYFILNSSGSEGYVINTQGSLNFFGVSNPSSLITSNVSQTTLPTNAGPISLSAIAPSSGTSTIFIPEATTSRIAALNSSTAALYQETAVDPNPVYVVGAGGTQRVYVISQGINPGTSTGTVTALEAVSGSSLTVSADIPVGRLPVYGVMTADTRRAFILNQGSANVSVLNVVNNAPDVTTPTIALPNIPSAGGSVAPHPVWADLSPFTTELVVLNQGDSATVSGQNYVGPYSATTTYTQNQVVSYNGALYVDTRSGSALNQLPTNTAYFSLLHPGSLSIISIPLCSSSTPVVGPNCNTANPTDATGFGQVVSSPTVGIGPTMVSVLNNASVAYVINQFDSTGTCTLGQGSVSVVNLISGLISQTICAVTTGATTSDGFIHGHPNSISATSGTPTGKVYVTSADSADLSIIYTDTNTVQSHVTLQGLGLRVLVTAP